jgi:site-specific DNA recombinase
VVSVGWGVLVESLRGGYAYYVCNGKSQAIMSRHDEKCPARYIPVEQLDALVWQDVCEVLTHPEMIAAALQRAEARAVASTSAAGEA